MPVPMPNGKQQYFTNAGVPMVGGKLYTYAAGTSTPKTAWADALGTTPHANPIVLNGRGEAQVFFSGAYKLELRDATDALVWTIDNFVAVDSTVQTPDGRVTVPSGTTVDLGQYSVREIDISGTDQVQAFGSSAGDGAWRILRFTGACTLVHNATSLALPGGQNILTSAGDTAVVLSLGSGNWVCVAYQRAASVMPSIEGPLASRNLVINGGFTVNARVQVSGAALAAGAYGHDRWKAGSGGATYTFTQLAGPTTITITAGTLQQVVEDKNVVGGDYVLSWAGTAQARVATGGTSTSGAYAASPIRISGAAAGQAITVEFGTGTLTQVQLEQGKTPTPYAHRPYQHEADLCERYFQLIQGAFMGLATSTSGGDFSVPLRRQMRANPTMTNSGNGTWLDGTTAASVTGASLTSSYYLGPCRVAFTGSGLTASRPVMVVGQTLKFDAEL